MRNAEFWDNALIAPIVNLVFGHTIPVAPFPSVESCLALKPNNSQMAMHEGYVVMSFDYKPKPSTPDCLFNLEEYKKE